MRKYLALSVVASTLLMAGGDIAPVEPVVEAVPVESVGKFSGQARAFYIDRTYDGTVNNNRNSLAVGGWIKYETAVWNGFSAGVAAYGVEGIRLHDQSAPVAGTASYDPSLYGDGLENYGFFGEAYLNYDGGEYDVTIGRQKLNTPLAGADDARMLPNLFEAAVAHYKGFEDTTLVLAHVTQMTVGTFGNVYGAPSQLSLQSGYGFGYQEATSGDFEEMGYVAAKADTDGVTAGAVIYDGIENLKLQAWNYYAHDLMNAVYLQGDYGFDLSALKMTVSGQYINQSDVGDSYAGDVDSNYYGAKLAGSYGAFSAYFAYSTTDSDTENLSAVAGDPASNTGIISPWGGMPAFTQGMVTRHQFFADTDAWKVAGTYKMNELLGMDIKASAYYVEFDVGSENSYQVGQDWTAKEAGFDIQYQATKDLNLRFRGNFPTDFAPGLDWDEYRLIANYNF